MTRDQAQQNIDAICQAFWDSVGSRGRPWSALPEQEKATLRKRMEAALDVVFEDER